MTRPGPFPLAFGPFLPRFEALRQELEREGISAFDRDAWVLSRAATELLHELRPEESLGEGVGDLVALAHAAYLYWQQGERVAVVNRPVLDDLLRAPHAQATAEPGAPTAYYVEPAPHRVWGTPVAGAPPEPLEGWFTVARPDTLDVVAVFGLLPGRPGFSVAQVSGGFLPGLARSDGSPLFAPVLEGAASAGLWSVVGAEELLDLAWRVHRRVQRANGPAPGRQEVAA